MGKYVEEWKKVNVQYLKANLYKSKQHQRNLNRILKVKSRDKKIIFTEYSIP